MQKVQSFILQFIRFFPLTWDKVGRIGSNKELSEILEALNSYPEADVKTIAALIPSKCSKWEEVSLVKTYTDYPKDMENSWIESEIQKRKDMCNYPPEGRKSNLAFEHELRRQIYVLEEGKRWIKNEKKLMNSQVG